MPPAPEAPHLLSGSRSEQHIRTSFTDKVPLVNQRLTNGIHTGRPYQGQLTAFQ
jgi:hypothetical protein